MDDLPSCHHRENLQNNAFYPTSVHTPIGGIFGDRGESRCPRTLLTGLSACTEECTSPTRDDQIGANGRRRRSRRRRTAEESMDENGSDRRSVAGQDLQRTIVHHGARLNGATSLMYEG